MGIKFKHVDKLIFQIVTVVVDEYVFMRITALEIEFKIFTSFNNS